MEAVVIAEMEMRLTVGVTSTWSTLRPRGSLGALSGREFFMAFPNWCDTKVQPGLLIGALDTFLGTRKALSIKRSG